MIRAKKSLGQNFLIDENILKNIVSIIKIENKSILEIGPGTGNLTSCILKNNPKKTLKMIFDRKRKAPKLLKDKKSLKDWVDWLTRVRAVDENEVMDLRFKGKKSELKDNFKAWFSYDLKIMKKHRSIVFGHWAALEGKTNVERIHALDTGCVWNRKLTAMRLEDGRKFSVNKIN